MEVDDKIEKIRKIVAKYDTESFAGFFAYLIKKRPNQNEDIALNKFRSKYKDFLYLIALNAFATEKGTEKFEFSQKIISELADLVNEVRSYYHVQNFSDYTQEAMIHELAFRNHFDNGVLSYVEQDLEKIRTTFLPFEDRIVQVTGLDIDFLINVYKETEIISNIRHEQIMRFTHTDEFADFHKQVTSNELSFSEALNHVSVSTRDAILNFYNKTHSSLLFSKDDLCQRLPKAKVDKFLTLFSCSISENSIFQYYTDQNPLEFKPILQISNDKYLHICQKQLPISIYKFLYDLLFQDEAYNVKVRKHREINLENKTNEVFKKFFSSSNSFFYQNYFLENDYEQDLLIIHKGIAIIIEAKASKLREPFRDIEKAVIRIKDDFKNSIQYGYNQCRRVEKYFFGTEEFEIKDSKQKVLHRIKPKRIHTVFSIIVTIERFGSLQTDLALMLDKEADADYPWSVYIDDLEIFLLSLQKQKGMSYSKLYNFLRNRRLLHGHSYAIDELDVCGFYIKKPDKFQEISKMDDTFYSFSPFEQGFFDDMYFSGELEFNESIISQIKKAIDEQRTEP
jgi:hypothetical protein